MNERCIFSSTFLCNNVCVFEVQFLFCREVDEAIEKAIENIESSVEFCLIRMNIGEITA